MVHKLRKKKGGYLLAFFHIKSVYWESTDLEYVSAGLNFFTEMGLGADLSLDFTNSLLFALA